MSKVKFKEVTGWKKLGESNQNVELVTAICHKDAETKEYYNVMPFIRCRDFYSDILYVQSGYAKSIGIYGFSWDYDETLNHLRLHLRRVPLAIRDLNDDNKYLTALRYNLSKLHEVEAEMGMRPTWVRTTDTDDTVVALVDSQWFYNSALISFYTLLLRIFAVHYPMDGKTVYEKLHSIGKLSVAVRELYNKKVQAAKKNITFTPDPVIEQLSIYANDINLMRRITTDKDLVELFIYRWREWCGDKVAPKNSCTHSTGVIHGQSCIVSLLTGNKSIFGEWKERAGRLLEKDARRNND